MKNPFKWIKSKIGKPFILFRRKLEELREKRPEVFDFVSEAIKISLPFLGVFAPALLTGTRWLMVGNLVLFSSLLTLQWATLKNEGDRRVKIEQEKHAEEEKILDDLYGEDEEKKLTKAVHQLQESQHFSYQVVDFSHLVSHNVKQLSTELTVTSPQDGRMTRRVIDFLQESINSMEDILQAHYKLNIRASVKLGIDENTFKTYARGKQNILSRGGELAVRKLNGKKLLVKQNYAYDAIVNNDLKFFAEGNLTCLHNKIEEGDQFFCEYENYLDLFQSTFIMPIRIIDYQRGAEAHEILGLVCIDCPEEMIDWNDPGFDTTIGYHIVADYADSLALLMKKYKG